MEDLQNTAQIDSICNGLIAGLQSASGSEVIYASYLQSTGDPTLASCAADPLKLDDSNKSQVKVADVEYNFSNANCPFIIEAVDENDGNKEEISVDLSHYGMWPSDEIVEASANVPSWATTTPTKKSNEHEIEITKVASETKRVENDIAEQLRKSPDLIRLTPCKVMLSKMDLVEDMKKLNVESEMVPNQKHFCEVCSKTFCSQELLACHRKTTHDIDEIFHCKKCSLFFEDKRSVYLHIKAKHNGDSQASSVQPIGDKKEKPFSCNYCGKLYKHNRSLLTHIAAVHEVQPSAVKLASALAVDLNTVKKRLTMSDAASTSSKKPSCPGCGEIFSDSFVLGAHMRKFNCGIAERMKDVLQDRLREFHAELDAKKKEAQTVQVEVAKTEDGEKTEPEKMTEESEALIRLAEKIAEEKEKKKRAQADAKNEKAKAARKLKAEKKKEAMKCQVANKPPSFVQNITKVVKLNPPMGSEVRTVIRYYSGLINPIERSPPAIIRPRVSKVCPAPKAKIIVKVKPPVPVETNRNPPALVDTQGSLPAPAETSKNPQAPAETSGNHPVPAETNGNPIAPSETSGNHPVPAETNGNPKAPSEKSGNHPVPAETHGNPKAPSETSGNRPVPAETNGNLKAPSEKSGNRPVPAETHENPKAPSETSGNHPVPAETNGNPKAPSETSGNHPVPAETHGNPKAPTETSGNHPVPAGASKIPQAPAETSKNYPAPVETSVNPPEKKIEDDDILIVDELPAPKQLLIKPKPPNSVLKSFISNQKMIRMQVPGGGVRTLVLNQKTCKYVQRSLLPTTTQISIPSTKPANLDNAMCEVKQSTQSVKCSYCSRLFVTDADKKLHVEITHKYLCEFCDRKFLRTSLSRHDCYVAKKYPCGFCDTVLFCNLPEFANHFKTIHSLQLVCTEGSRPPKWILRPIASGGTTETPSEFKVIASKKLEDVAPAEELPVTAEVPDKEVLKVIEELENQSSSQVPTDNVGISTEPEENDVSVQNEIPLKTVPSAELQEPELEEVTESTTESQEPKSQKESESTAEPLDSEPKEEPLNLKAENEISGPDAEPTLAFEPGETVAAAESNVEIPLASVVDPENSIDLQTEELSEQPEKFESVAEKQIEETAPVEDIEVCQDAEVSSTDQIQTLQEADTDEPDVDVVTVDQVSSAKKTGELLLCQYCPYKIGFISALHRHIYRNHPEHTKTTRAKAKANRKRRLQMMKNMTENKKMPVMIKKDVKVTKKDELSSKREPPAKQTNCKLAANILLGVDKIYEFQCTKCLVFFGLEADLVEHKKSHDNETKPPRKRKQVHVEDGAVKKKRRVEKKPDPRLEMEFDLVNEILNDAILPDAAAEKDEDSISLTETVPDNEDISITEFGCSECSFSCDTQEEHQSHQEDAHGIICCGVPIGDAKLLVEIERKFPKLKRVEYSCDLCGEIFIHKKLLFRHITSHMIKPAKLKQPLPLDTVVCTMCKREVAAIFLLSHLVWMHSQLEVAQQFTSCQYCGCNFNYTQTFFRHMRIFHGKAVLQCEVCSTSFTSLSCLESHASVQHGIDLVDYQEDIVKYQFIRCDYCHKLFPSKQNLSHHLFKAHNRLEGKSVKDPRLKVEVSEDKVSGNFFCCIHCYEVFFDKDKLEEHWEEIVERNLKGKKGRPPFLKFKCPCCEDLFINEFHASAHLVQQHSNCQYSEPEGEHVCKYCPEQFSSANQLYRHMRSWHLKSAFDCSICLAAFPEFMHLKDHYILDHGLLEVEKIQKISFSPVKTSISPAKTTSPVKASPSPKKKVDNLMQTVEAESESPLAEENSDEKLKVDSFVRLMKIPQLDNLQSRKLHVPKDTNEANLGILLYKLERRRSQKRATYFKIKKLKELKRLKRGVKRRILQRSKKPLLQRSKKTPLQSKKLMVPSNKKFFRNIAGDWECAICRYQVHSMALIIFHTTNNHTKDALLLRKSSPNKIKRMKLAMQQSLRSNLVKKVEPLRLVKRVEPLQLVNKVLVPVACKVCGFVAQSKQHLGGHVKYHCTGGDNADRTCKFCDRVFTTNFGYKIHMGAKHQNLENRIEIGTSQSESEKEAAVLKTLNREDEEDSAECSKQLVCPYCKKHFNSKKGLNIHHVQSQSCHKTKQKLEEQVQLEKAEEAVKDDEPVAESLPIKEEMQPDVTEPIVKIEPITPTKSTNARAVIRVEMPESCSELPEFEVPLFDIYDSDGEEEQPVPAGSGRRGKEHNVFCINCKRDYNLAAYSIHLGICYRKNNVDGCPLCNLPIANPKLVGHVVKHFDSKSGPESVSCDLCSMIFFNSWNYMQHNLEVHL